MQSSYHRFVILTAVSAFALTPVRDVDAQSLRGSRASIERMYRHARREGLSFFQTPASVRRAVDARRLVRLEPNASYDLHQVTYPYVRPATRTFVRRIAEQYSAACGEPLVVTSGVRPATRQPANSTARSVHPTGMAVDFRKPQTGNCLRWLRETLLDLEGEGVLEATEEQSPAHFHVAVFSTEYTRYVAMKRKADSRLARQF
jgi:hypothetical protein